MSKPIVLHIGEPIKYNHDLYSEFTTRFTVIRSEEPDRASFISALKSNKFGAFSAIFRPHFQTGGEMGQWDDELISLLPPSVKIFASAGAGFNWADTELLAKRGIWYANGAGASDEAVSDTALWLVLGVFRNYARAELAARSCDPERFTATHKLLATISRSPRGHVLGIVGLGNISKKLAQKARDALGMKLHYFDVVRASPEVEKELGIEKFHDTLESLLSVADCVSLHVPLNKHTDKMINAKTLSVMKPGARLVNTSRGQVVDEAALVEALRSGQVSAAGLDVHENEPHVNPELAALENVTVTTHIAGGVLDTRINFEKNAMRNILAVVGENGSVVGKPLTPVNRVE